MGSYNEPWRIDSSGSLWDAEDNLVVLDDDTISRIVACVNACEGCESPDPKTLVHWTGEDGIKRHGFSEDMAALEADRRRLRAALEVILDQLDGPPTQMIGQVFDGREIEQARRALGEGGNDDDNDN